MTWDGLGRRRGFKPGGSVSDPFHFDTDPDPFRGITDPTKIEKNTNFFFTFFLSKIFH